MSSTEQHPETQHTESLSGKTALVVGGGGGVGEGVVRGLLAAGATVISASRNRARLDDLAERVGSDHLHTATLDALGSDLPARADAIASAYGPLHAVIVSIAAWGSAGRKPVLDLTDDEWDELLATNLTAVFRLYRSFLPLIDRAGMMLHLNGLSADLPFPGAGGVALAAAATKSLTRTVAAEVGGDGPRVHEIILGIIRTRSRQLSGIDDPQWIDARVVGDHVAQLLSGVGDLADVTLQYFVDRNDGPQSVAPPPPVMPPTLSKIHA